MKYNKGFAPFLIVLIVLGVLATGGGIYYLGKSSNDKELKYEEKNIPIKNTEENNSILPDSFSMEMYGNYDSSGAGRTYQGELTFKNNEVISGSQVYIVGEGRNCQDNCNRKTECMVINQKWVDKNTGGGCTIDAFSTPLNKEGIIQKINESKFIQVEDLSNCKHAVTCYKITNIGFNGDKIEDNSIKEKSQDIFSSLISGLTVPKDVHFSLSSSVEKGESIPVLELSALVGNNGCVAASDLSIEKIINGNTLNVDIKGYKFKKGAGEMCPAVMVESRANINIDLNWLKQNDSREIVFKLNGQINKYKISYNKYKVTLSGIQATNVFNNPQYSLNKEIIASEVTLYPLDVAIMYLAGSFSGEKDFIPAMRNFAKTKGFIPVDEIYDGITQKQNEKNQFYVVLRNYPRPDPDRGVLIGELPDEKGVNVYLKNVYFIK